MKREYLEQQSLCDLFDLLSKHTLELLNCIQKRSDCADLKDMKSQLELIQDVILQKKLALLTSN